MTGPSMGATTIPSAQNAIACPRFSAGKDSRSTAWESGCNPPPHAPWMIRKMIKNPSDGANPQRNDDAVNPVTAISSRRLRPKRPASQPVIGRMMAFATKYEVKVHVASSTVADKLPAIWGNDTFTTVVSSTSMKVLDMTAIAISQGLISGRGTGFVLIQDVLSKSFDSRCPIQASNKL